MNTILWLASWYPNRISPFDGDFIQRHAKAVALTQPVHVIYVVKDEKGIVSSGVLAEDFENGNLKETIVYYKPYKTGYGLMDKIISFYTYCRVYSNYLKNHIKKNGKPALVHLHVVMRAGLMALYLKKKYSLAYVVTEHWTGYDRLAEDNYYKKNVFFRYAAKQVLKQAWMLLPVSRHLGETISRNIQPVKCSVVPNVADTSFFRYSNHKAPVFRFIHVSSMNYQKNVPGILHCLGKLLSVYDNWECVMVGPAGDELKTYSNGLGLYQKITWAGELPYEGVADQMRQASAFILFSRYENLPCVLLEAACCGLPVIAPDTGGIAEIVHACNGQLIEPGNEEQLLKAMIIMMENYSSYNRKKISDEAVGLFNYGFVGRKIISIYEMALKESW